MSQNSVLFASAKVKMRQRNSIDQNDISRLLDSKNYDQAIQALLDIGFINSETEDYETAADNYVLSACELVNKVSPNEHLTNALLYNYDAHNLKVLFKARILGVEPSFLYNCGVLNLNKLKHAVINHNYSFLPVQLKSFKNEIEKLSVTGMDPLLIDAKIDKAVYSVIFENLNKLNNPTVSEFFNKKVVFINTLMMIRVKNMGKKPELLQELLIDQSSIKAKDFIKFFNNPQKLHWPLLAVDKAFADSFMQYINGQTNLSTLEKTADNSTISVFKKFYYKPISLEYIANYLIATQRQAAAVRLVMAGKQNAATNDSIKERMRAINAK